jgi:DNA-binding transcriptional regulator GbsR (MarR family)
MNNSNQIQEDFFRFAGEIAQNLGLNRTVGQIYGLLYLNDSLVSLEDIVNKLKISKGSASLNIRELERWQAVKKIWVPGSRKDFYQADTDFVNIIYKRGKFRIQRILDNLNENIAKMPKNLFAKSSYSKIEHIFDSCRSIQNILKILPDEISIKRLSEVSIALNKFKILFKK